MFISRLQVNEGFLDGLDVTLTPGLNVVIGARGTGKTSIIELIRYCLDVPGHTPETTKRSREHALSILGSGEVIVTVSDGTEDFVVRRGAGEAPERAPVYPSPIVFSQTEIETIGLQSSGRTRLIDGFSSDMRASYDREESVISSVRSITIQIDSAQRELDDLARQLNDMPRVDAELAKLAPAEDELKSLSAASSEKASALDKLTERLTSSSVYAERISRDIGEVIDWKSLVQSAIENVPQLDLLRDNPEVRSKMEEAIDSLRLALKSIQTMEGILTDGRGQIDSQRKEIEQQARTLRQEVDRLQTGSGAIVSAGMKLRERKAQLVSLSEVFRVRRDAWSRIIEKRAALLDDLDQLREERFAERRKIAQTLSLHLGPRIRVSVKKAGRIDAYVAALTEGLRGSGIRYNELAQAVAESVSPRELVILAENEDAEQLSKMLSISIERASRLLSALRQAGLASLATVPVEDEVSLELLDGKLYKNISDLSTGQRCTTILPIVLQHAHRVVVVDQPEDHIDNAFIADTLVRAILSRPKGSQLIVSTHNANIPVLGSASTVTQMGSDGRRGFVAASGDLASDSIVDAIYSVMEGGKEAFARRAQFYREHAHNDA